MSLLTSPTSPHLQDGTCKCQRIQYLFSTFINKVHVIMHSAKLLVLMEMPGLSSNMRRVILLLLVAAFQPSSSSTPFTGNKMATCVYLILLRCARLCIISRQRCLDCFTWTMCLLCRDRVCVCLRSKCSFVLIIVTWIFLFVDLFI